MVTKADIADVFVFDGADGIVFPVAPDPSTWPAIDEAWDKFAQFVSAKNPPPLTKGDVRNREDPEWAAAAMAYLQAKRAAEGTAKSLDEAKAQLIGLATHTSESGGGVSVTRYWKSGTIDYKKVPILSGVNLEQYRGAPREECRVTAA